MFGSIRNRSKGAFALLGTLCVVISLFAPLSALAAREVGYMPGVTEEMTDPAFWSAFSEDPDALLATPEQIAMLNEAAVATEGTARIDMRNLKETYNGIERQESLKKSAAEDVKYYLGWVWDETGKKLEQEDFDRITANMIDPDAAEEMPVRWGIAVNRTELVAFPWDGKILDDPADIDFNYQPLVGIRVNEPVAIYATSADGKYYQVSTSCCPGWVRAEDIALCKDKEEWLSAWDIPAEKRLVFWGDKMYTDYSNSASDTVCRMITMGTVLERMDEADPDVLVINRLPLHNYAVYLPVRNEDGSYGKTPALINARECVSEDYLPLTAANLAKVALASLGDAYGWGGGLNNEDCTSLNHSVFCCFGLDMPRNGTWQKLLKMIPGVEIAGYTLEEKEKLLDVLPMGTLLNFPGHQMMYLGKQAGEYYVVSTVSSLMSPWSGNRQRTRCCQINKLDTKRANGKTWMEALNRVNIPWILLSEGEEYPVPALPPYHEYTAFCVEKGLIDPYPTGYFLADRTAVRVDAVEMLWRTAGKPEPDLSGEGFTDVPVNSEHEKAALWAKQAGIYTGEDGQFKGKTALTGAFLAEISRIFLNREAPGIDPASEESMTRAEFAQAAQSVWNAYAEQTTPKDPFGEGVAPSPDFAYPCGARLASLPEALTNLTEDGSAWAEDYAKGKPADALTLMDYPNIWSFIHTHSLEETALRQVLSDTAAFTEEEIDLLLGDGQAKAMAHFASPSDIVIGEKGYSEKWIYAHPLWAWRMEGITPDLVAAAQPYYAGPLFTQEAADAFARKLSLYTGIETLLKDSN